MKIVVVLLVLIGLAAATEAPLVCSLCSALLTATRPTWPTTPTQTNMFIALGAGCQGLPSAAHDACVNFVTDNGRALAAQITSHPAWDDESMCRVVHECDVAARAEDALAAEKAGEGNIECEICTFVLTYVESFVGSNHTEAKIQAALDKVCQAIPFGLSAPCQAFVNANAATIINKIIAGQSPATICQELKACTSAVAAAPAPAPVGGAIECEICSLVLGWVEGQIGNNATEAKIEAALDQVCGIVPGGLKAACEALVSQYTPQIINLLLQKESAATICKQIGLCTSTLTTTVQANAIECEICTFVLGWVETQIGSNATEAKIEAALDQVCGIVPGGLKAACEAIVNQYTPEIISLLLQKEPAASICKSIGLCSSSTTAPVAVVGSPIECEICTFVLGWVEAQVGTNATEAKIEAALDNVCDIVPSGLKAACEAIINQYTPQIINLLLQKESAANICKQIGLCTSTLAMAVQANAIECEICTFVLGWVETQIGSNATEAKIEAALDQVCGIVPGGLKAACEAIVNQYTPEIISLLLQKEPAASVCKSIGLCSSSTAVALPSPAVGGAIECEICTFVLGWVETQVGSNATEAKIEAALDKVCGIVPGGLKAACEAIVNQYTPEIISLLLQKEPAASICKSIGLCSSTAVSFSLEPAASQELLGGIACTVCEQIVGWVESQAQGNDTQAMISFLLGQVCNAVPGFFASLCKSVVDKYTPLLIQYITQNYPADVVCEKISLCSAEIRAGLTPAMHDFLAATAKPLALAAPRPVGGAIECEICTFGLSWVENQLDSNKTEARIEELLGQVCGIVPKGLQAACTALINNYLPEIIQSFVNDFPAADICKKINLCPKQTVLLRETLVLAPAAPAQPQAIGFCSVCTVVVSYVEFKVGANKSISAIEAALGEVCSHVPKFLQTPCNDFVAKYTPELVIALMGKAAGKACQLIGVCPKTAEEPAHAPAAVAAPAGAVECEICQVVINFVLAEIGNNNTEANVVKALEGVCSKLPIKGLQVPCEALVDEYAPALIQAIVADGGKVGPAGICAKVKLCPKPSTLAKVVRVHTFSEGAHTGKVVGGAIACEVCQVVYAAVQNYIAANSTVSEIEKELDTLCSSKFIPAGLQSACTTFVDAYTPEIVQAFLNHETPAMFCQTIRLCPKSQTTPIRSRRTQKINQQ